MLHIALVDTALQAAGRDGELAGEGEVSIFAQNSWESRDPLSHFARIPLDIHWLWKVACHEAGEGLSCLIILVLRTAAREYGIDCGGPQRFCNDRNNQKMTGTTRTGEN